ncbi:YraN family protein [Longitalea luteola]|uniref:YraN family protein n=1 Tax=Longitalea luteola TaxID=2812563 RepID=UPI001A969CD1|nr:YraN family protein [Longitalea luteola]
MSYQHHDTGKKGEDMAVTYLQQLNFTILHRNWRHARYEIDVIAARDNILHIIEVKTRTNLLFGHPEESISKKKINYMLKCARAYMYLNPQWREVQYNILSITLLPNQPPDYFFIEDVYL